MQQSTNHLWERLDVENKASHSDEGTVKKNHDRGQQTRNDEAPPIEESIKKLN